MRILIFFFLCLFLGNSTELKAKKPVTFRILIAEKLRRNVSVTWSNKSIITDANGMVTFPRSWYQKRNKGKRIRLELVWNAVDPLLNYKKDTIITLDAPITVLNCPFEPLRQSESKTDGKAEQLKHLKGRKLELLVKMQQLQTRVATHIGIHPESLMSYYEKWIQDQITIVTANIVKLDEQISDLDKLRQLLFENDVLMPQVEKELHDSDSLRTVINPSIEPIEKMLPEISLQLENDPDVDLTSGILFDSGSDSLKPTAQTELVKYVTQKSKQLNDIIAGESGQTRQRVCILSFTGYADTSAMAPTVNSTCPSNYRDSKDGNLCLSWRRANSVQAAVIPVFKQDAAFQLKPQPPVGMGRKYALADAKNEKQDKWRKCTISAIYVSKAFYDNYVQVQQARKD